MRALSFVLNFTITDNPYPFSCHSHQAPVSGVTNPTVPPGQRVEIRRIDLAGDLCSNPYGAPGCSWRADLHIDTDTGGLDDSISFSTRP